MYQLVLIVKVTHNCNMNCIYCYDREKRHKQMTPMTLEGAETILKTFTGKYENIFWVWHGGEPLLQDPDTFYKPFYEEVLPKYLNKGTKYSFGMQTNLTLLNEKHLEWILKYDVNVGTSFDGIHNLKYRIGGQKWEEKALLFNREAKDANSLLGVGMTVTPDEAEYLIESHEYMKKYTKHPFYTPVFGWEESMENTKKVMKGFEDFFYYLLTETDDELPRPYDIMMDFLLGKEITFCENVGCLGRWFAVDPNMDVYPCGRHWPEEYKYGNLNENTLKEILKSKTLSYLRGVNSHLSDKCIDCSLFNLCKCGCYNSRLAQKKTLETHDEYQCYYYQELHRIVSFAIFANFDKITNKTFLHNYGEQIKNILNNNMKEKN